MAALTQAKVPQYYEDGTEKDAPVSSGVTIYEGALVNYDDAGYVKAATADDAEWFAGVALESVDNSAGADGAKTCRIRLDKPHRVVSSGLTQADVNTKVWIADDQTVTGTQPNASVLCYCGNIHEVVSATDCFVDIGPAVKAGRA